MKSSFPPSLRASATRLSLAVVSPVRRFLNVEASAGILLLAASVIAVLLANTSAMGLYVRARDASLGYPGVTVHSFVNEGLMTFFFFVVGLELRRETASGELSELRRALTPVVAALGGMLVPALVYYAINHGTDAARGWGVPTATDIAFAVGVLTLLGKRATPAMRVLLLALAVVDDLGAVLVMTFGYAGDLSRAGLPYLGAGTALLLLLRGRNQGVLVVLLPLAVLWHGLHLSGIHPSLSGVAVGLALRVEKKEGEAHAPVEHLLHTIHPWAAFVIMPLFALVNAGVAVSRIEHPRVAVGVASGLLVGKAFGIFGATWAASKLGLITLPRGVQLSSLWVVAVTAGIGFTMSLFIADAAFVDAAQLQSAKVGVLLGSSAAAVLAFVLGRTLLPLTPAGASTVEEAEASTEK